MAIIWDDPSAYHTITNGGLTATRIASTGWNASESLSVVTSGKLYWEYKIEAIDASRYTFVGCGSGNVTQYPGQVGVISWGYYGNTGNSIYNGVYTTYGATFAVGDIIGVALDLTNGKIYFSKNGVWQNSGDPVAGTNPAYTGIVAGTGIKPSIGMYVTGNSVTGRFTAASQTYAPPTGFSPLEYVPSTVSVLAFYEQPYSILADAIIQTIEQIYSLTFPLQSVLEQIYGLKLAAMFSQYYGDVPVIARSLVQYYGDAYQVKRVLVQMYGDALAIRAVLEQPYVLPAEVSAFVEQRYGISGAELKAVVDQLWSIRSVDTSLASFVQPFGLLGDPGQVLTYTVAVVVDGTIVDPLHVNIEAGREQFCISSEVHVGSQADYLACEIGADLDITINGESFSFFIESRNRNRGHGSAEYVVKGLSKTSRLDAPYADTISGELSGMASAIVAGLATGFTVDWRTVDWYIPANTLLPADQTPMAIIRDIAHAAGAIVQTAPDGTLVIEPDYPLSVPAWDTATVSENLSDSLDFFTTSETFDHRPGYNKYLISDQLTSENTLRLEEETISETVKEIRGYKTPWVDDFTLRHSGGDWVTIEPMGVEIADKIEVIEFIAGEGRTQYPIYGISAISWLQANLGTVTHAEDGRLVALVEGESLLSITYQTKCRLWKVTNPQNEKVQFIADEVGV